MKNLSQFSMFDLPGFLTGKTLTVTAVGPWVDFDSKAHMGTKVGVVITEDKTTYPPAKDGGVVTNLFERLTIKVGKDVSVPIGATVEVINGRGTVYGEYRNQLSIKADDVKVVSAPTAQGGSKA